MIYGPRQGCYDSIPVIRERRVECEVSLWSPKKNSVGFAYIIQCLRSFVFRAGK